MAECAGEDEIREAEEEQEGFEIVVQGRLGDCKGDPKNGGIKAVIVLVN